MTVIFNNQNKLKIQNNKYAFRVQAIAMIK